MLLQNFKINVSVRNRFDAEGTVFESFVLWPSSHIENIAVCREVKSCESSTEQFV